MAAGQVERNVLLDLVIKFFPDLAKSVGKAKLKSAVEVYGAVSPQIEHARAVLSV